MAAGLGTRMKSATPKVLHELGGRSLVGHAVVTARALSPEHLVVVVGNGRELVEAHLKDVDPGAKTAVQEQQRGTGDAVRAGLIAVPADFDGSVIVTSNYGPAALATRLSTSSDPVAGQRIVSRLLEDATVVHLDRPDQRLRGSQRST